MKRFLSIFAVGIIGIILLAPKSVDAVRFTYDCGTKNDAQLNAEGLYVRTCTIGMTENTETIPQFQLEVIPSQGVELGTVNAAEGWSGSFSNNILTFISDAPEGVSASTINLGSFTVQYPKDIEDCSVVLKPVSFEGQEVEVEITVEEIVETGATLPLLILGCGILVAGIVYYISKKNTKMYKI